MSLKGWQTRVNIDKLESYDFFLTLEKTKTASAIILWTLTYKGESETS